MSRDAQHPALDRRGLAKGRIKVLSDGIFAVAMSLLVLDIKSPVNQYFATADGLAGHLAIPTFAPSRLDRLFHSGAATRTDHFSEES
jgi:hypothetical protein